MEYISDGIRESLDDALQSSDAIKTIDRLMDEMSRNVVREIISSNAENKDAIDRLGGRLDGMQKASISILETVARDCKSISEAVEKSSERTLSQIKGTQKKVHLELGAKLSEARALQSAEFDSLKKSIKEESAALNKAITENHEFMRGQIQSLDAKIGIVTETMEEIAKKLDYLCLPFYKRTRRNLHGGDKNPSKTNKEAE